MKQHHRQIIAIVVKCLAIFVFTHLSKVYVPTIFPSDRSLVEAVITGVFLLLLIVFVVVPILKLAVEGQPSRASDRGHDQTAVVADRNIRWVRVAFYILLLPFLYFICPLLIEYLVPISPLPEKATGAIVKLFFVALAMFASLRPLMKELEIRAE